MSRQRLAFLATSLLLPFAICCGAGCSGAPLSPSDMPTEASVSIASSEPSRSRPTATNLQSDVVVTVQATSPQASEAGPVAGEFTVFASYYTAEPLTVNYTVGGTATASQDYTALSGSVTIPAGQTTALIPVVPIDDSMQEPPETVVVTLTSGIGYTVGTPASGTVTIADNDTAVKCRCSTVSYEFDPGGAKPQWGTYLVNGNSNWRVGFRINVKCTGTGSSTQCTVFQIEKGALTWTIGGKSGEIKGQEKKVTKFHKGKLGDPWEKEYSDALGADYPNNSTDTMSLKLSMEFEIKCVSSDGQSISKRFRIEGSVEAKAATKGGKPSLTGADPQFTALN